MANERLYTSRRSNIVEALVLKLKDISGAGQYLVDLNNQVYPFLKFWDEVEEFPAILEYSDAQNNVFSTQQITLVSIDTDEGVLEPLGVGEILIEVQY